MKANGSVWALLVAVGLTPLIARNLPAAEGDRSPAGQSANLAPVAKASTSYVSGHETLSALNDGFEPASSNDKSHGAYGNWPRTGTQWVQYEWTKPIATKSIAVYWFDDNRGVRLPKACRLQYWDGTSFVAVTNAQGLGVERNEFNTTTFPEIISSRLKLEFDSNGESSTGILEWRVYDSGNSPNFPPSVSAGKDRVVVLPGGTWLAGTVRDDSKVRASPKLKWSKASGPGRVKFEPVDAANSTARFSKAGDYVLKLTADDGELSSSDTIEVRAEPPPPKTHLQALWPGHYSLSGSFWPARTRNLIVNWIPHCIQKISDPKLAEGGIENFVQAANKLAGRPATKHVGYPFSNAWVYNTIEAMCLACMVDAQGDQDILKAQDAMRKTLQEWIPIILSAQEPDGYLHTLYTINGHKRWSNKADHEGYTAGYFLEAAIAHYLMTQGADTRMLDAAKHLADCWCANIGPPPRKRWYEGHEEVEQALVRFARFLRAISPQNSTENLRAGKCIELARFLLDCRRDGEEYDQSHVPVTRQYEAVGHAVRAAYCYSAMADIAMETGDVDYLSAAKSLWNSIVNRKYYVTGGIGSGETPEGFGNDYSLPNRAYCESCADCGQLFFAHKLQLIYGDAQYADCYEETLFNAILGSLDLEAKNFTYTNPLDSGAKRYQWHACPCCVGNIPRTLLMLPTWMYSMSSDALFVSLYAGSAVKVPVAGESVEIVQTTDYPWSGKVALSINPAKSKHFTLKLRIPTRGVSALYAPSPACQDLLSIRLNGSAVKPVIENGYASLSRKWSPGDKIELELPMEVQRLKPSSHIASLGGKVALRYGPLIYNTESADQNLDSVLKPDSRLSVEWNPDLLGGVMVIKGVYANGEPLTAIPNYARLNRGGRSIVWLKDQ